MKLKVPEGGRKLLSLIFLAPYVACNPALAVDGVLEINQACVAAGCFTGDTAGFPVDISNPGSYRLTGDLSLPDLNAKGIAIQAADVTIDLNGFAIRCPSCAGSADGHGISADRAFSNITVRNGTVRNVGGTGIRLHGDDVHVDQVRVIDAGGMGISLQDDEPPDNSACSVTNSVVRGSGSDGIEACRGPSRISNNLVENNGATGISADGSCVISGNVARSNQTGIVGSRCIIEGNTATSNAGRGISGSDSTMAGNNSSGNGADGISCDERCVILGNAAIGNDGFGLSGGSAEDASGYSDNYFAYNNGGNANPQVSGGLEIGTNACGGDTTCP